jgi:hypothetical protein
MSKKILFCSLFILIFLIPSKQDPNAKTWPLGSKIPADSILAAIERGDSIDIRSCEIVGSLIKEGTPERPDTIRSFILIVSTTFHDTVSFNFCYFMKRVVFSFNRFKNLVSLLLTTFVEDASFWGCIFRGDVDLRLTTFCGGAFFYEAEFEGLVDLSPREYDYIDITWEQLKDHLVYRRTADYKLMKYFEEQRQLDDADGIYLFMKDQERMQKSPWVRYPEYWFIQLTCGYGRKPLNTFILSIVLVTLFAVFFTNSKAIKEIEKESGHRRWRRLYREIPKTRRKRFYYALYFSLHTFIIGVVSDWHATDEFLIGNSKKRGIRLFRFRTLSMIEGALGWILVIILIISLERTIGR